MMFTTFSSFPSHHTILMSRWSLLTFHGTVDFHLSEHVASRLAKLLTLETSSLENNVTGCSITFEQPDVLYVTMETYLDWSQSG